MTALAMTALARYDSEGWACALPAVGEATAGRLRDLPKPQRLPTLPASARLGAWRGRTSHIVPRRLLLWQRNQSADREGLPRQEELSDEPD